MSDGSYNLYPLTQLNDTFDWGKNSYPEILATFRTAADKGVLRFLHISCINAIKEGLFKAEVFVPLLLRSYEVAIELAGDTDAAALLEKERDKFKSNYRNVTPVDLDGIEQ